MMMWLMAGAALAQTVNLPWQGRVLDGTGAPVEGEHSVVLELWNDASAGTRVHREDLGTVTLQAGYLGAQLSDVSLDALDEPLWLLTLVDGQELPPRLPLGMVPRAAHAESASVAALASRAHHVDFQPEGNLLDWRFADNAQWQDPPDLITAYMPGYPGLIGEPYAGFTSPTAPMHHSLVSGAGCYPWAVSQQIPIDPNKAYEASVWIFSEHGTIDNYLGFYVYDSNGNRIAGAWDNPYFKTGESDPMRWVKHSGLLVPPSFPSSGGVSSVNFAESTGVDWVFPSHAAFAAIRFGGCYASANGSRSFYALPSFRELP